MKFQRIKDIASGAIVSALIIGTGVSAYAKIAQVSIPVSFQNIKIMIDGKQLKTDKEPFIYDGTTYLPVRDIGEAMKKRVGWDSATKTIYIDTAEAESSDDAKKDKVVYSKTTPAPVGTSQEVTLSGLNGSFTINVTVESSVRGDEALNIVKNANIFNGNPPAGMEYAVVKIKADVISHEKDGAVNIGNYDFTAYGKDGTKYDYYQAVAPEPKFGGTASVGDTLEGYAVYCVNKTDTAPKLVIGEQQSQKWFAI
ncbi:copper amine oxidase N-terminal domain-containing protein [Lachnospiraceae bacterium NSJ-143]|nr:copper amine oxidase N-terminal domain-containing protein [Lachnospiraceae bacterium NSJ-143]